MAAATERRRIRRTDHDRTLRRELRAARRAEIDSRPLGRVRRLAAWPLIAAGLILFLASYLGAITGTTVLPFDPHHTIGQLGGGALAAAGLTFGARRR